MTHHCHRHPRGKASANYWCAFPHRPTPTIPTLKLPSGGRDSRGLTSHTASKEANGATSKNGLAVSYKVKHTHTIWPGVSLCFLKETKIVVT